MFDRLKAAEEKFISIESSLSDPDVISDIEKYTALMKEYKNLSPIVMKLREYNSVKQTIEDAKAMLELESDKDNKKNRHETKSQNSKLVWQIKFHIFATFL